MHAPPPIRHQSDDFNNVVAVAKLENHIVRQYHDAREYCCSKRETICFILGLAFFLRESCFLNNQYIKGNS